MQSRYENAKKKGKKIKSDWGKLIIAAKLGLNFKNHVKIPNMVWQWPKKKKDEWEQDRHKVVKTGLKKVKIGMKLQETTAHCQNVQHILG